MRTHTLLPLLALFLLSACGSAPPAEASQPAAPTQAATSAATLEAGSTAEPSATPSPAPTQLPYSGPNPRLALFAFEGDEIFIRVIELGSEELVATIPIEGSWKLALSPDGRMLFNYPLGGPGTLYDLDSGESHTIDLSRQVSGEDDLYGVIWSSSQQWLVLAVTPDLGLPSLWVYSLETGTLAFVDEFTGPINVSSREDILSYIHAVQGSPRITYNLATGQKTVWRNPNFDTLTAFFTHDGLPPDRNSASCRAVCLLPELGMQVRDYTSKNRGAGRYDFHLVDTDAMRLLAHVATFRTERDMWDEHLLDVVKLLPLWQRGDYLLLVQETRSAPEDLQLNFYSAWSLSAEMPFTVVEGEQANTLPNVIPIAVSPDGTSFVGFRFTSPQPFIFVVGSAVVVDLATAEILYEFPLPAEQIYFSPPNELLGAHIVWPGGVIGSYAFALAGLSE